jgi:hypothetical protein
LVGWLVGSYLLSSLLVPSFFSFFSCSFLSFLSNLFLFFLFLYFHFILIFSVQSFSLLSFPPSPVHSYLFCPIFSPFFVSLHLHFILIISAPSFRLSFLPFPTCSYNFCPIFPFLLFVLFCFLCLLSPLASHVSLISPGGVSRRILQHVPGPLTAAGQEAPSAVPTPQQGLHVPPGISAQVQRFKTSILWDITPCCQFQAADVSEKHGAFYLRTALCRFPALSTLQS